MWGWRRGWSFSTSYTAGVVTAQNPRPHKQCEFAKEDQRDGLCCFEGHVFAFLNCEAASSS